VVIPIYDRNPVRRPTVVTFGLIAANLLVFLASPTAFDGAAQSAGEKAAENTYLYHYGAIPKDLLSGHSVWTVLTAMFVHAGWIHLLGNMLFLFIFGNNVEDRFGRIKFLLFYLVCGYVAAYGFAYGNASSTQTLVGASGAIAGVLGAYLVMFPRARVMSIVPLAIIWIPLRLPAWLVLGGWFLLQWLYSSGSGVASGAGVAYLAHVYGFVAGAVIALLARPMMAGDQRAVGPLGRL
jgi:membrane associated rhomboid family serine protease